MNDAQLYYQHSGKWRPDGFIWMLVFGALSAAVLGIVYGYAIFYIPFVFLNFVITFFFGVAVGVSVAFGARLGKVRNMKLIGIIGLLAGLFAEYTGWVAWLYEASEQGQLVLSFAETKSMLQVLAAYGVWSVFDWTPTGWQLYTIWAIEAIMIVGCAAIAAAAILDTTLFCEQCGKWVEKNGSADTLEPVVDVDDFKRRIETAVTDVVGALGKSTDADNWSRVDWCYCDGCDQSQYLSVTTVKVERDEKNKEKKDESKLVVNLRLSAPQLQKIRQQLSAG